MMLNWLIQVIDNGESVFNRRGDRCKAFYIADDDAVIVEIEATHTPYWVGVNGRIGDSEDHPLDLIPPSY